MKILVTAALLVFLSTVVSSLGYTSYVLCPPLSPPADGSVFVTGLTFGSAATYSCFFGHILDPPGFRVRRCLLRGIWSGEAPVCRPIRPPVLCPALASPANGFVNVNRRTPGGVAEYLCNSGFSIQPETSRVRTCQSNGRWSGVNPICNADRVNCQDPGTPANGRRLLSSTFEGAVVEYFCSRGFELEGDQQRTCQSNGQWSGALPVCKRIIDCGELSNPQNGIVTATGTVAGSTARYSCNSGFVLRGIQVRVCQANSIWSGEAPTCVRNVNCGPLQNPRNGFVLFTDTTQGSSATYSCRQGFVLIGNARRTCQSNSQWSGEEPFCQRELVDCGNLASPQNGFVSITGTSEGSNAIYRCRRGFRLDGNRRRRCLNTGEWSGQEPFCRAIIAIDCGSLDDPRNGIVNFDDTTVGSTATYRCNEGFVLVGNIQRSCLRNGEWSGQAPICRRTQAINCRVLSAPNNGRVDLTGTVVGSSAVYSCRRFFFLSGGSRIRVCRSNGEWSGNMPSCLRRPSSPGPSPPTIFPPIPVQPTLPPPGLGLPCSPPPAPANGQVFVSEDDRNSIATYECNAGFRLVRGDRVRFCQLDGTYSGIAPACVPTIQPRPPIGLPPTGLPPPNGGNCPHLSPPKDGLVKVIGFNVGDQATYSCFPRFRLVGNPIRICLESGAWSSSEPACITHRFIEHLNN